MPLPKFRHLTWTRSVMAALLALSATLTVLIAGSSRIRNVVIEVLAERFRPKVVFVGDSLTAGGGPWGSRVGLHMFSCQNFGHGGIVAEQMVPHMRRAVGVRPAWISLCVGANDVTARHYNQSETVADVREMIEIAHAAGVRVALTLVPQQRPHLDEIDGLNIALREMPADVVIDLSSTLAPNGVLLDEFTIDGVHLSPAAYLVWAQELRTAMRRPG